MKSLMRHIVAVAVCSALPAMAVTYNDATGEIDPLISTAGGTLDIVSMEVANTLSDITFTLTVNGDISTTDWGKFLIGIANQNTAGTTTGNGWGRPINLDAGAGNGMTHWIGSWVDSGSGAELWSYNGATWDLSGATYNANFPGSVNFVPGANSVLTYTTTLAALGLSVGDTISFDAYSTSGTAGDSAVDALSNPNTSITAWNQAYTSDGTSGLSSYTVVPEPSSVALFGLGSFLVASLIRRRK